MASILRPGTEIQGRRYEEWSAQFPLLQQLVNLEETTWVNPAAETADVADTLAHLDIGAADVSDAAARLARFASYIRRVFPETKDRDGIIESPLRRLPGMEDELNVAPLWMKCDNDLPISGSIKARGGIYEVLEYAERVAVEAGLIPIPRVSPNAGERTAGKETNDATPEADYRRFGDPEFRRLFGAHSIAVGSTGNLGLSIGLMGATLGFDVTVHMSSDARRWKKELLRSRGVTVREYDDDYSTAVAEGRREAATDPRCHFVDDENSRSLFLGYAVAAERLARQLTEHAIVVDSDHPLHVYLPCGVGGGPGGVTFGLKHVFGDAVRCFFAEPTHAPAMFIGLYTGMHETVSVQEFGIDNVTVADGLAVGRPSGFVGRRLAALIDGVYTVSDETMLQLLAQLHERDGIDLEPSALAALAGPPRFAERTGATHIVWATGGSMVPPTEMAEYIRRGEELRRERHRG